MEVYMLQNNQFNHLITAYHSGSLIIHNAKAVNISPLDPDLNYQTITSALMFPIGGEAEIQLDNKVFAAKSGKMIYIPYSTDLKISVLSQSHFSYINLFHQLLERPLFEMDITNVFNDAYKLLTELVDLSQSAKPKVHFPKSIMIKKLFFLLQNQKTAPQDCDYTIVKELIDYMNIHYHQEISLEKLAKLANKKESQISYLFKKYTNKRPIDYLIQYRIKVALELIETTDLLINEVAEKVGYQDSFYFSRLFKKYTGISPTALRLQAKHAR